MEDDTKETIVISLGGSLIVPEEIDIEFLRAFKSLIISQIEKGKKFILITGGGKVCRKYQNALRMLTNPTSSDLDWLGIYTTRLNADFLRLIFGPEYSNENIVLDPTLPVAFQKSIILGGGWEPGNSTDLDAVLLAKQLGSNKLINLSNIDFAYDKDPNKFPDAKRLENVSWAEYRSLIPKDWDPGLSTPFDPIASKLAEEYNIEVAILNGKNISNLEKCLNGEEFVGTKIS